MGTPTEYVTKIQDAVAELPDDELEDKVQKVMLSSGVILRMKQVPVLRINAVLERFQYPPVPELYDKEHDRILKNPDHPLYKEECQKVDMQRTWAMLDAVLAVGTEIIHRPAEVPAVEDDTWIEELEMFGIAVRKDNQRARYLAWVKFVAVINQDDLQKIAVKFGLGLGVAEEKVANALQGNFPNKT